MIQITEDMKTDWLPGHVKPVHVGGYEREYWTPELRAIPDWWDGTQWHAQNADGSFNDPLSSAQAKYRWRGLKAPYDGQL